MVIDGVRQLSHADSVRPAAAGPIRRVTEMIVARLGQAICGMRGHVAVLHLEPRRLSLQCELCGYHSPGWKLDMPPARRLTGDPSRHRLTQPRLRRVQPAHDALLIEAWADRAGVA